MLNSSYFTTIPGGRPAGRAGAGGNKIKANSAQLNLAGAWAELGKTSKTNGFDTIEIDLVKGPKSVISDHKLAKIEKCL